jgi:cardiolipin synthase
MGLTLANLLSVFRMALIPFFIIAVTDSRFGLALVIFGIAGATDFFDGVIARLWRQQTSLGAILDPMADKLLLTAAFIVLALPDHPKILPDFMLVNRLPIFLAILSIGRDVIIALIAGVLYVTGTRSSFAPTFVGKLTTAVQILTVLAVLFFNFRDVRSSFLVPLLTRATLALVLISGLHYIYHAMRGGWASEKDKAGATTG